MLYIKNCCKLLFLKIIKILNEADTEETPCLSRFIDISPFQETTFGGTTGINVTRASCPGKTSPIIIQPFTSTAKVDDSLWWINNCVERLACNLRSTTGVRRTALSILKVLHHIDIVHGSETEMDSSEREDMKIEVGGALYTLTRDALIEVCDLLTIAGSEFEEVSGKSRSSLILHVYLFI